MADILPEKVREAFQTWDAQGQGTIGRGQLMRIIRRLTPHVGEKDLEALFSAAGADPNGGVKYDDFIAYLWADSEPSEAERLLEAARQRGLWENAINEARAKAAKSFPSDRVDRYWDEVKSRLAGDEYSQHVKTAMFVKADQDKDGRICFEEAKALILKSLKCAAAITHTPQPTDEDVRDAFDAHDTLVEGRGRMGADEFVNLARYLQVRVADAMLPLSKVITE
eukprot:gb/GFBE01015059.1/.p1 GENE.gb/GFBE01015059.1/~~gb/GFBE01015059.1/.p1  ORF type:complete len:224 (+),score=39.30 gb/GFBE01015059.1/:1-672(+)